MVTLQVERLIDFVTEVFAHADSSAEEARRIATYLTTANLTGHDSHGVIRVPVYIRWKKMGSIVPDQTLEVVVNTPSLAVVDGKFGYGQTVAPVPVSAPPSSSQTNAKPEPLCSPKARIAPVPLV